MNKLVDVNEGVRQQDCGVSIKDDAKVRTADEIDHMVRVLGSLVVAARDLSDDDHSRIRRFILAAGDLMSSRDRLKSADRQIFEIALRDAAGRRQGY